VVNRVETLRARRMQYANQIDGRLRIAQRMGDRLRMAHIRLDGMDLADIAKRLQMKCKIGTARGDADPPASDRQGAHHMPPNKPRTAEHRHKPVCLYQFLRHVAGARVQGLAPTSF
jgi:hypothetical protein